MPFVIVFCDQFDLIMRFYVPEYIVVVTNFRTSCFGSHAHIGGEMRSLNMAFQAAFAFVKVWAKSINTTPVQKA